MAGKKGSKKVNSEQINIEAVEMEVKDTTANEDFSKEVKTENKQQILVEKEMQLDIFKAIPVRFVDGATQAVIENLGGGDVYSFKDKQVFVTENLIAPFTSKVVSEEVCLISASRPKVKITYLK